MMELVINGERRHTAPINPCLQPPDFMLGYISCLELLDWWFYAAWCIWWRVDIEVAKGPARWFCLVRRGKEIYPVCWVTRREIT